MKATIEELEDDTNDSGTRIRFSLVSYFADAQEAAMARSALKRIMDDSAFVQFDPRHITMPPPPNHRPTVTRGTVEDSSEDQEAYRASLNVSKTRARGLNALVVVESPFLGGIPWAVLYARLALREQLRLGRVPFASHLLYPQAISDAKPEERKAGIEAGWAPYAWGARCEVYTDFGISVGMMQGIEYARSLGRPVVYRAFGAGVRDQYATAGRDDLNEALLQPNAVSNEIAWPGSP